MKRTARPMRSSMSMMSEGGIPRQELEATLGKKVAANDWYVILVE